MNRFIIPIGAGLLASSSVILAQTGIQDAMPASVSVLANRFGEDWNNGNSKYDGWYNLTIGEKTRTIDGEDYTINGLSGYPGTFASTAYPNPIASQVYGDNGTIPFLNHNNTQGSGRANFNKVAQANGTGGLDKFNADGTRNATDWGGSGFGPYPAGDSIYAISFSNAFNAKGGTFGAFEANPVANLANVLFQVEIGSANGYDFWDPNVPSNEETPWGAAATQTVGGLNAVANAGTYPTLNLTFTDSSSASIPVTFAELYTQGYNGTIPMPTGPNDELVDEPIWINLYAFQWDLSSYSDIASFSITFNVAEHSQLYAVQLDQSDTFFQAVQQIPEVSSALLGGLGLLVLLRRRR